MGDPPVVLLVDDEPRMLSALQRTLRREGWSIDTARDASEGLARLASAPSVSVLVSDHKMPGMSGIEFLAEAKSSYPGTARILLSGFTGEIPSEALARAGVTAILSKPWDNAELKASIHAAVRAATELGAT